MHIDHAHSITIGRNKEQYYLMIVIDSIDFTWAPLLALRWDTSVLTERANLQKQNAKVELHFQSVLQKLQTQAVPCF
jgi:hypothetical protein